MYVDTDMLWCMSGEQRPTILIGSRPPLCGLWELDSGWQACTVNAFTSGPISSALPRAPLKYHPAAGSLVIRLLVDGLLL